MIESKGFPVLSHQKYIGCPSHIRWDALNSEHAEKIHSQSLERLAERWGLSPEEIVLNVEKRPIEDIMKIDREYALSVVRKLSI